MSKTAAPDNGPAPPQEIFQALQDATSQDPARLRDSSERLKSLEERLGTWDVIHQIASQRDLPLNLRRMAMIQFKNGAVARWKSRRQYSDEHRASIRQRTFQLLQEEDDTIADCNAITVGKIARADYPVNWPNLVPDLCSIFQNHLGMLTNGTADRGASMLVIRRSLANINSVTKELSSMKMLTGARAMQSLAEIAHTILFQGYFAFWEWMSQNLESIVPDGVLFFELIRILHLVFKPLAKIITWTWPRAEKPEYANGMTLVNQFFSDYSKQWKALYDLRRQMVASFPLEKPLEYLTKHLLSIGKTFRKWQRIDGRRFTRILGSSDFVYGFWQIVVESAAARDSIADTPLALYPTRFLVQGMVLFRDCLPQWSPLRVGNETGTVLNDTFVTMAVEVLVTRFMPLSESDLAKWFDDPEVWSVEESKDTDAWEYELRPCSERVLVNFVRQYPELVVPMLSSSFERIINLPISNLQDIVSKEAVYCAIGCCTTSLTGTIDLKEKLVGSIAGEITSEMPQSRILKRRIAWLIGKWIGGHGNDTPDAIVWDILSRLVADHGPGSDAFVRLTAAAACKACADTISFDLEQLLPFLNRLITGLLQNLGELEAPENKRAVMSSMSIVIERSGKEILPYTTAITSALPSLWTEAEAPDDALMKAEILTTMTVLIKSLKEDAHHLCPFVLPLLGEAFSPQNKIQLDVDAFELWLALLRNAIPFNAASPQDPLLGLFEFALQGLSNDLDLLGTIIRIVESYFLLGPSAIVERFGASLFTACKATLAQAIATNAKGLIVALNLLFSLVPASLWLEPMIASGLFSSMLQTFLDDKLQSHVLVEYVCMFARMAMADGNAFLQLVSSSVPSVSGHGANPNLLLNAVLEQWWIKFDSMSSPRQSKLAAMGVAGLVATGHPVVMERLPSDIFNMWADCFREMKETSSDRGDDVDDAIKLFWERSDKTLDEFLGDAVGTLEENRRRKVFEQDPVQSVMLTAYISAKLSEVQVVLGGPAALETYLNKADPHTKQDVLSTLRSG